MLFRIHCPKSSSSSETSPSLPASLSELSALDNAFLFLRTLFEVTYADDAFDGPAAGLTFLDAFGPEDDRRAEVEDFLRSVHSCLTLLVLAALDGATGAGLKSSSESGARGTGGPYEGGSCLTTAGACLSGGRAARPYFEIIRARGV